MIRRPPRSTLDRSSAASDVYKRQLLDNLDESSHARFIERNGSLIWNTECQQESQIDQSKRSSTCLTTSAESLYKPITVSYTHLRAHETVLDLVCRLSLETKKKKYNTARHTI